MDRDDVTSAGLTAIGILAGAVAQAVALGGRMVAAGLETLESALRSGEESFDLHTRSRPSASTGRSSADSDSGIDEDTDDDDGEGFARLPEPAFEPADGVTAPARAARSVTRRSSAGAAARTAPGPRPAKRATATSLPPNLRAVEPREQAPEPAPVEGATGAADVAAVTPAKKATAKKATAKKATAKTTTAKTTTAKKATAKTTTAKKAAKKAPAEQAPAEQAPATHSAESAHTRPEGTSQAGEGSIQQP